jgi:hypothetical protein
MTGTSEGDAVGIEDRTSKGRADGDIERVSEGETVGEAVGTLEPVIEGAEEMAVTEGTAKGTTVGGADGT